MSAPAEGAGGTGRGGTPLRTPLPRLSAAWDALRQNESLRGRDWSRAAGELADSWLRELFGRAAASWEPVTERRQAAGTLGGLLRRRRPRGTAGGEGTVPGAGGEAGGGTRGEAASEAGAGNPRGVALVAVGSLGRGDLAPGSDLDLVLVHAGQRGVTALADALWYPIWDDPMPLDHSVRTLAQVTEAAESDLRVALGLLDARVVAGDGELGRRVVELGRRLWEAHAPRWLPQVLRARAAAQEAHGDVAFLLEPELQEARGGLRDVQVLSLLARTTPVLAGVAADVQLRAAADFLHAVRVELQRPSGRRSDRLLLEDQDRVAAAIGSTGREALAHDLTHAARLVSWTLEDATRRVQSWLSGPRGRAGSADKPLGTNLVVRDDEVVAPLTAPVATDPTLALRAATASAEFGLPLSRQTMSRLAEEAQAPPPPWREDVRRAFLRLLSTGAAGVHAIETLDQLGVWELYVPEWAAVRNRPQFDPYHRFTVDRHLLETVAEAATQAREVRRPDLLLLAALLHDIGKGSGRDHSEAGGVIAAGVARRLGLPPPDAATLEVLVLHHLLLPDTATRRDIEDPATAEAVAAKAGDAGTLELLAALTAADGHATGTAAWGKWKADLVARLVQRAGALLEGKPLPEGAPFPTDEHRRLMATGTLQVVPGERPGEREVVIVAPDRPGLLADVTGALALHGIGVLGARAHSEGGRALEVFSLDLPDGATPRWDRVARDVEAAALRQLDVAGALASLAEGAGARSRRRSPALPPPEVRVSLDNDGASAATVLEVRAPDAPGLLHHVSAAISGIGLDIASARVATLGNAAVDTFYVQASGLKLAHAEAEAARQALEDILTHAPAGRE